MLSKAPSRPELVKMAITNEPRVSLTIVGFKFVAHPHLPGNQLTQYHVVPTAPYGWKQVAVFVHAGLAQELFKDYTSRKLSQLHAQHHYCLEPWVE